MRIYHRSPIIKIYAHNQLLLHDTGSYHLYGRLEVSGERGKVCWVFKLENVYGSEGNLGGPALGEGCDEIASELAKGFSTETKIRSDSDLQRAKDKPVASDTPRGAHTSTRVERLAGDVWPWDDADTD